MRDIVILSVLMSFLWASDPHAFHAAVEKHDLSRAKAIIRPEALSGDGNAMFDLGLLEYMTGHEASALRWMQRSAQAGVERAHMGIGIILFSQSQEHTSLEKSAGAFKEAGDRLLATDFLSVIEDLLNDSDKASAQAYYHIASLYYDDLLIVPDQGLSFRLMRRAADKAFPTAAREFAKMLLRRGGPKSVLEAQRYFHLAALAGDHEARYREGKLYLEGPRGVRDLKRGEALLKQAVEDGYDPLSTSTKKSTRLPFLFY